MGQIKIIGETYEIPEAVEALIENLRSSNEQLHKDWTELHIENDRLQDSLNTAQKKVKYLGLQCLILFIALVVIVLIVIYA